MQFARRATPVVALLLLASVATASAECAWVLWFDSLSAPNPVVYASYARMADCVKELDQREKGYRGSGSTVKRIAETLVSAVSKGGEWGEWLCLPDTVQPRGQKGK